MSSASVPRAAMRSRSARARWLRLLFQLTCASEDSSLHKTPQSNNTSPTCMRLRVKKRRIMVLGGHLRTLTRCVYTCMVTSPMAPTCTHSMALILAGDVASGEGTSSGLGAANKTKTCLSAASRRIYLSIDLSINGKKHNLSLGLEGHSTQVCQSVQHKKPKIKRFLSPSG